MDLDPRFSPNEAKVIFVNTSNDGASEKAMYTQNVTTHNDVDENSYKRELLFQHAIMPDWE